MVGLAAPAIYWSAKHLRPQSSSDKAQTDEERGGNVASSSRPGFFHLGVEQTYDLSYENRVVTATEQQVSAFSLSGPIKILALSEQPNPVIRFEFAGNLVLATGAGAVTDGAAAMEEAARRPFIVELTSNGMLSRARFEPGVPAFVGRLWTALGEYLQVPRHSLQDEWQSQESDASGRYLADYNWKTPGVLLKWKRRYTSLTSQPMKSYDVLSSENRFEFDDSKCLREVAVNERTKAELGDSAMPSFLSEVKIAMRATGAPKLVAQLDDLLAQAEQLGPLVDRQREEDRKARDMAMIGGLTLGQAFVRLDALNRPGASKDELKRAERAYVSLTAMLRRDPSALAAVKERLLKEGPLTETLLAALRDSSSPESQRLLVEMTKQGSPLGTERRMEAARALSMVAEPTSDTVVALKEMRTDAILGTQGSYGLGSALHRLQAQDPELAGDVRSLLTEQLVAATTPGEKAVALTALGNAGDPETLDAIRPFTSDTDPDVRASAVQALRRIPGADVDQMIARFTTDESQAVRHSAVDVVSERNASPVLAAAVAKLALSEEDYQTRAKCVNVLAQWLPSDPSIAASLRYVAENDKNADLRKVAQNALGG
jgi:HEAT repeat protein